MVPGGGFQDPYVAEEVGTGAVLGEDVVDAEGQAFDGAVVVVDRMVVDCLAHATVLLVGDLEGARVCSEEGGEGGGAREDFVVFKETDVLDAELYRACGTFGYAIDGDGGGLGVLSHSPNCHIAITHLMWLNIHHGISHSGLICSQIARPWLYLNCCG